MGPMEPTAPEDPHRPSTGGGVIGSPGDLGAELKRFLRRAEVERGLTVAKLAKLVKISPSALYSYLSGETVPRAGTLDAIMQELGVPAGDLGRLATARDALQDQRRRGAGPPPPERAQTAEPLPPEPAATAERRPAVRRPRPASYLAAVLILLVSAVMVGVALRRTQGDSFDRLVLGPAPSAAGSAVDQPACPAQTAWRHRFPDDYRGEVYALLVSGGPATITAEVTLTWGRLRWQRPVPVHAGVASRNRGGTLLRFLKKSSMRSDPADWNPEVQLDVAAGVCAVFGTADTRPRPAPSAVVETPGWTPV